MRMAILGPAVAALLSAPVPALAQQKPLRVFVHTEATGEASELKARQQSVKDVTSALAGKKKVFAMVEDLDEAELVIEVIDRGTTVPRVVFGIGARPGQPPGNNMPVRHAILRVDASFDGEDLEFKNKNSVTDTPNGWKSAADDIVKQIEKWVSERGTVSSHDVD